MHYLTDNPLYLVVFGGFLTVCFAVIYVQTQDKRALPFLLGAFILTLLPILTDTLITSEREKLRGTVSRLATAVRQNDVVAAAAFAHPEHPVVRDRINREMPTYEFSMCNITGIRSIEFDEADPNQATIDFIVFVNVRAPRYGHEGVANRGITLNMKKYGDEWKISNYNHYPPMGGGR